MPGTHYLATAGRDHMLLGVEQRRAGQDRPADLRCPKSGLGYAVDSAESRVEQQTKHKETAEAEALGLRQL